MYLTNFRDDKYHLKMRVLNKNFYRGDYTVDFLNFLLFYMKFNIKFV